MAQLCCDHTKWQNSEYSENHPKGIDNNPLKNILPQSNAVSALSQASRHDNVRRIWGIFPRILNLWTRRRWMFEQLYVTVALPRGRALFTKWLGGLLPHPLTICLVTIMKRRNFYPYLESNPSRSIRSHVTILTELFRFLLLLFNGPIRLSNASLLVSSCEINSGFGFRHCILKVKVSLRQNFRKETVYSNWLNTSYEQSGQVYVFAFIAVNTMSQMWNISKFTWPKMLYEILECLRI
jgi:hypothetical protein